MANVLGGRLAVKKKGMMINSWPQAECTFDRRTRLFTCRYPHAQKPKQLPVRSAVDVANRPGKRQHRFDVVVSGRREAAAALAAQSDEEKRRWLAAIGSMKWGAIIGNDLGYGG